MKQLHFPLYATTPLVLPFMEAEACHHDALPRDLEVGDSGFMPSILWLRGDITKDCQIMSRYSRFHSTMSVDHSSEAFGPSGTLRLSLLCEPFRAPSSHASPSGISQADTSYHSKRR